MKFIEEFKKFAFKGNVVDMAVGVIIGGAFGSIVSSLVADIIMPLIGIITGELDFTDMQIVISRNEAGEITNALKYGQFIQNVVYFLIVAFSIFIVVKLINKGREFANRKKIEAEKAAAEAAANEPKAPTQEELLAEIRDLLAEMKATDDTSKQ